MVKPTGTTSSFVPQFFKNVAEENYNIYIISFFLIHFIPTNDEQIILTEILPCLLKIDNRVHREERSTVQVIKADYYKTNIDTNQQKNKLLICRAPTRFNQ